MKPSPTPLLEGTPWEKLDRVFRTALTVPKKTLLKEEARLKRPHQRKRVKKKTA